MKGLTKNINIVKVDLSWNGLMGETLAKMLRKLFMKNKILAEIDLQYNRWAIGAYVAEQYIFQLFEKNFRSGLRLIFARIQKVADTEMCIFVREPDIATGYQTNTNNNSNEKRTKHSVIWHNYAPNQRMCRHRH